MYCPNCGCTNNDDAVVCDNCGAKLENNSNGAAAGKNPNKEKTIIIILIIVLIILSIVAAGIIGTIAHKKSNDNTINYSDTENLVTNEEIMNDETNYVTEKASDTTEKEVTSTTKPESTTNENATATSKKPTETTTKNNTTTQKNTTTTATTEKTTSKSTTEKTTYTEYRYRDKSFKTSSSSSMSGWTLYDTTYSWSDYGSWSDWSTDSYSSSDSRQVETRTTYRFHVFRCTKCGNRDPYSTPCDNCKTSQYFVWEELWYPTKGNSMSKGTLSTVSDKYYVTINGALWWFERDGYSDGQGGIGQPSRKEYRYRDRKQIATYHFYKWSDWSKWSKTPVSSSETREVETRKVN